MTAPPLVDVLVVNFRTGDLARRAVAAISGPGVTVHVWDNSGELLDGDLPVHGDGTNTWFAPANNALYRLGSAPYVLLLNPDVELPHNGLQQLVADLEERPGSWGVAPRLVNSDGTDQGYLHALPTAAALVADRLPPFRRLLSRPYRYYVQEHVDLTVSQAVEQPPAACLLLRRAAVGAQLFDERYRLFFNDTDLARRLNVTGDCWYDAAVPAVHLKGASFRESPRGYAIAREYDRTLLRYARDHVRGWQVLVPVVLLRLAASSLLDAVRRS